MKTEHQEQCALIARCDTVGTKLWPTFTMPNGTFQIISIPNGGKRTKAGSKQLKNAGVRRGVPDLFIPVPMPKKHGRGHYCGLWIELKTIDGGIVSDEQTEWITAFEGAGYYATVSHGCDAAWAVIEKYMEGEL